MSSNEDRIARWRARREAGDAARAAHGDLPTEFALIATQASVLTMQGSIEIDGMLALVLDSLRSMPSASSGERRQIYDAMARGLEYGIEKAAAHPDYAELRRRQARIITRLIEGELRSGGVASAPGYRPAGLDEAIAPLEAGYRRSRARSDAEAVSFARRQAVLANEAYSIAVPEEEEGDLIYLRELMVRMDQGRGSRSRRPGQANLRVVTTLVRYQFALLKSESRIALIWTLLGPAVLMALISAVYFLVGTRSILNMDVPTFAILGAATWVMFRNVIFRSSGSFHGHRWLLNVRPFSPLLVGLTQGVMYIGTFGVVVVVLITGGYLTGLFTLPQNPLVAAFWFACIGVTGLAIGVIFGSVAVVWHYFLRFAAVIERGLQMFSGVIFVSEQLPMEYRAYVLWSPITHALQLLRSAYFEGYTSDDASAEYFFISLGVLIVIAITAQSRVRWRSAPM